MINTYSDSPLIKMAKLSIADPYYLQGGSKSLAQAEVEYRDWIQFFPDDKLTCDTMMKIAEIHLKQVIAADRTRSRQARRGQLKEMLRRCPDADRSRKQNADDKVQEILAMTS